jgi:hypothetical protein
MLQVMRRKGLALAAVATAALVVVVGSASSAPQALSYSRMSVTAQFSYELDYGSHPDSTFNGTYRYYLLYRINAIVAFNGRTLSASSVLADGGASVTMNMTQRYGPSTRQVIRCSKAGSTNGQGLEYNTDTDGGRFSGGGGVGVSNSGLTVNPGRAITWSLGCSATETLETHGLPGGPGFRVPAPAKSRFVGRKRFVIACTDSYEHDFEPAQNVPGAHKFSGNVDFAVQFTPFPASQLTATKKRLRDQVGDDLSGPRLANLKDCP